MKKTFAIIAMLSIMMMFVGQMANAQTLTCKKYASDVTFTIDGDLADWPADAKVIDAYTIANVGDHSAGPVEADITFDVYLAWDSTYLYIAYDVTDPTGLDETEAIGSRYLDDMFRLYLETDTDGTINDGPDNDEFGVDLRASTTGPLNEVTVISWDGGNFADPADTNLNGSANGTMVATTAANDDTAYTWEARVAWADILAHGTANSTNLSMPQAGDTWTWDMLLIDDGPVDGQQFNLTTLHDPSGWADINFVDVSSAAPANPAVHDGYYACKVINNAGAVFLDRDTGGGHFQLNGGTEFLVSFWMRSGGDAPVAMTGQVQPFDSTPSYMPPATNIFNDIFAEPVPTDWTYYEGTYVPEEGVTEISLRFDNPNGTSYIIDDVKVIDTTSGENIIPNGSFEEWGEGATVAGGSDILIAEDGVPNTWRFVSLSDGDGEIVRLGSLVVTNAQEGMYAAKVTRTADGGDSAFDKDFGAAPDAHMSVEGIAELKLSFWMRSGTGATVPVGGQIQPFGSGGYMPPSVDVVGPLFADGVPATWKYFESAPYVPDEGVLEVSVRFNTTAPNSFVVDDIKLIDTATGTDIMTNGGMEAWGGGAIVGDPVAPDGVPDNWRMFAVAGAGGMIERLQFQPPAPNAIQIDWTTMQ